MRGRAKWLLWLIGVILIGNFIVLMKYGDTLKSTNLFITRSTVFYPLAWLNLIAGVALIVLLVREIVAGKRSGS